jgi:hypothetical protein
MRFRKLRIALSATCLIACVLLIGCNSTAVKPAPANTSTTSHDEVPAPSGPTITVPLYSVVSTSTQDGLERASEDSPTIGGKPVLKLLRESDMGAPSVFLVDAPTLTTAILGTHQVRRFDRPATLNIPEPPTGNYWLAVFLGISGSTAPNWLVDSVTIQGSQIRFSYHWQGAKSKDEHHYYYWAPIGELNDGNYSVELYDTKLKEVALMQRVEIKKRDQR